MKPRTAELVALGTVIVLTLVGAAWGIAYVCREFQGWRP